MGARIRTIKPEFWTDEELVECSFGARLLFIGLWNFCDDAGVHILKNKMLKMQVFPGDNINDKDIQQYINELKNANVLIEFEGKNRKYLLVKNWEKHQKINRPNTQNQHFSRQELSEIIGQDLNNSVNDHGSINVQSLGDGMGREGKGREINTFVQTFSVPLADETYFDVTPEYLHALESSYTTINVVEELKALIAWASSNKARRKTLRGIKKHINFWLNQARLRQLKDKKHKDDGWLDEALKEAQRNEHTQNI